MEIQGRLGGQWMETSKRLRRRQPTVIGSLRPPIGWEKESPPPPRAGAGSRHAGCSTRSRPARPAQREAPPRPRVCALSAAPPRPPARPGSRAGFGEGSAPSLSVGTEHPAAPRSPSGTGPGSARGPRTARCPVRPGGLRRAQEDLRWGRAARGAAELSPGAHVWPVHATPRGGTDPEARPEGACPAAGPGGAVVAGLRG